MNDAGARVGDSVSGVGGGGGWLPLRAAAGKLQVWGSVLTPRCHS